MENNTINPLSPEVEKILDKLKQGKEDFVNYYGKDAEQVMVDRAIKLSKKINEMKNIKLFAGILIVTALVFYFLKESNFYEKYFFFLLKHLLFLIFHKKNLNLIGWVMIFLNLSN